MILIGKILLCLAALGILVGAGMVIALVRTLRRSRDDYWNQPDDE